jgi:hypothetical protein
LLKDFRRVDAPVEMEGDIPTVLSTPLFCAPPLGLYKTNWDAAPGITNAWIGVGIIACDSLAACSFTLIAHAGPLLLLMQVLLLLRLGLLPTRFYSPR